MFYVTKTKECRGGKKKKVCPFLLLENSRPLSPWGPPDLSTCLGIDSLIPMPKGPVVDYILWVSGDPHVLGEYLKGIPPFSYTKRNVIIRMPMDRWVYQTLLQGLKICVI